MSEIDRDVLQVRIRTLENWLQNGTLDKPTFGLLLAFQAAVDAMKEEQTRSRLSYDRPCAVLMYHIMQPAALLFRDPVTILTVKTGLAMLERKLATPCRR